MSEEHLAIARVQFISHRGSCDGVDFVFVDDLERAICGEIEI